MSISVRLAVASACLAFAFAFAFGACASGDDDLDQDLDLDLAETDVDSTASAISRRACPDGVPSNLAPAADQHLAFVLPASGVQKYTCAATATGFAWTFVAPEADLFRHGRNVGIHYAGPTWEYRDGSTVVAAKAAEATPDPTAIPWLLLTAVSHGGERGKMTRVQSIQRLTTNGGNPPSTGCDADHVGAAADVPYTADYFFYRTRTRHQRHNVRCGD